MAQLPDCLFVDLNRVDIEDLLRMRPGQIVRVTGDPNSGVVSLKGLQLKSIGLMLTALTLAFSLGFLAAVICFKVL